MENITKQQFLAYEKVRLSGTTNMFDIEMVSKISNVDKGRLLTIMKNYSKLAKRFMADYKFVDTIKNKTSLLEIIGENIDTHVDIFFGKFKMKKSKIKKEIIKVVIDDLNEDLKML